MGTQKESGRGYRKSPQRRVGGGGGGESRKNGNSTKAPGIADCGACAFSPFSISFPSVSRLHSLASGSGSFLTWGLSLCASRDATEEKATQRAATLEGVF